MRERIPFHTAADARAQMCLEWATTFGEIIRVQLSCLSAIAVCNCVHIIHVDHFLLINSSILWYITTPFTDCALKQTHKSSYSTSYSPWLKFAFGFFFSPRSHLNKWWCFSLGNWQQEWGFNVGAAGTSICSSVFEFRFRLCILWWKLFVLMGTTTF